jgi:alkylated DNA nucleotide flippase Atl1
VITVSQLWPLPEVDEFTVSPLAPAVKGGPGHPRKQPMPSAVAVLAEGGAIADGTELKIVPFGTHAAAVDAWIAEQPDRGRAIWRSGEKIRALDWPIDCQRYSASGLAEQVVRLATGAQTSLVGPQWWALEDGTTLAELSGAAQGRRDWTPLHELLDELHAGEWTTYRELAAAIGSHPIAVGQHITRCEDCHNAWRVLGSDGRPRPNFAWSDPNETRTCRQVLEDEGILFTSAGAADPAGHVDAAQLEKRPR